MPGPAQFVSGIADDVRAGRNCVIVTPRTLPRGLDDAVRVAVESEPSRHCRTLDLCRGEQVVPAQVLQQWLFPGERLASPSAAMFARSEAAHHLAVWLSNPPDEAATAWSEFMTEYAEAARSEDAWERGVLLLHFSGTALNEPPREGVAIAVHRYEGVVGELDMTFWAAQQSTLMTGHSLERRVRVGVVAAVAGYDPGLVDLLAPLPLKTLLEPVEALRDYGADLASIAFRQREAGWRAGLVDRVDGVDVMHAAMLAHQGECGRDEIKRRIWSGQLSTLFPYLERRRNDLVAEYSDVLRYPFVGKFRQIDGPGDMEIADLRSALRHHMDREQRARLSVLIRMRNDLAHRRPANVADIQEACRWSGVLGGQ